MTDYQRELAELAATMQEDDPTLSDIEALRKARKEMTALYRLALDYNRSVAAQRSIQVPAA